MKTTEELRKALQLLAISSPEVAEVVAAVDDKRINWERAALHLYMSIAEAPKPVTKSTKTAAKG